MNKNYWIIPQTVGKDNNLKPLDKLIYAQILSLSKSKGYCYATNNYFAKMNNYLTKRTIINSLRKLKKYNYSCLWTWHGTSMVCAASDGKSMNAASSLASLAGA